jgi:hypothetical protein
MEDERGRHQYMEEETFSAKKKGNTPRENKLLHTQKKSNVAF